MAGVASDELTVIYHRTQLQLLLRAQAHLANMLDNGKSGKGVHSQLALLGFQ
jgi:hypothetical protein